jgi:hypothetical protein
LANIQKVFYFETTWPIGINLCRNYVRRSSTKKTFRFDPTKNTADTGSLVSDWPIYKKMFSSETTLPVGTKHYMNDA